MDGKQTYHPRIPSSRGQNSLYPAIVAITFAESNSLLMCVTSKWNWMDVVGWRSGIKFLESMSVEILGLTFWRC